MPPRARSVPAHNLHLTLAFLGSVEPPLRSCLERGAGAIACPPFELVLDHAGWFPRPQVYWLGASQPPAALLSLVTALQRAQGDCGVDPETRPFRVHLTVARKVRRRPAVGPVEALRWPVDRFVLVSSRTLPEGPLYQPERTWMLQA